MIANREPKPERKTDRQELIKGWEQEKLTQAKVLIVGMGALGNEVAKDLALAGVGNLIIIDMDEIEFTNLNRNVLFTKKDVGKNKAIVAARSLRRLAPDVKVRAYGKTLQYVLGKRPNLCQDVDLILGCLDNMEARFLLNHQSVFHRTPFVDGGMVGLGGSVQVVISPFTPCLECNASPEAYANIGRRYSCTIGDYVDLTEVERRVRIPSVSTTTSIISGIEAQEALKILLGFSSFRQKGIWPPEIGPPLQNVIQHDGKTNRVMITELEKNPNCYVCGQKFESSASSLFKRLTVKADLKESLSSLKKKIKGLIGKGKINLVSNLKMLPDYSELHTELKKVQLKLNFLCRGIMRSSHDRKRGVGEIDPKIFRIYSTAKDLSRSPLLQDAITMWESMNKAEKEMNRIENLVKDIKGEVIGLESGIKQLMSTIGDVEKSLEWVRRYFSGDLSLSEIGIDYTSELYAVDPEESKTNNDVLVILSPKNDRDNY